MHIGPYEILGELGRGGMGVVYRARHRELGREIALKVAGPEVAGNPQATARLRREAQAAARLEGVPGIVSVHAVGEDDGRLWMAMPLIQGITLEALAADEALAPRPAAALCLQAARAVAAAHARGVLHRDLKPSNILLEGLDRTRPLAEQLATLDVHVTDFGLATLVVPDATVTRLTRSHTLIGTPAYMPPEQARGEDVGPPSDVFALGATLYELLVGRPPRPTEDHLVLLVEVLHEAPPPIREPAPDVPRELATIVDTACAFDPAERYATVGALADDLQAWLEGRPISVHPPPWWRRAGRWAHRRARRLTAGAAAVVVGSAAVIGLVAWHTRTRAAEQVLSHQQAARPPEEALAECAAAFQGLRVQSGEAMRQLEEHMARGDRTAAAPAAPLAAIRTIADRIAIAYPNARSPAAWQEYARFLAGDDDAAERLGALARSARIDPYPSLLYARLCLVGYALGSPLPEETWGRDSFVPRHWAETPVQAHLRREAGAALDLAKARGAWRGAVDIGGLRQYAAAGMLLAQRHFQGAGDVFVTLRDDPDLGGTALLLAGLCRLATGEFEVAAGLLERAAARGWTRAGREAAGAWMAVAVARRDDPVAATRAYERALTLAERLEAGGPPSPATMAIQGIAWLGIAHAAVAQGQDPTEPATAGIRIFERLCALVPDNASAHGDLAEVRLLLGRHRVQAGGDAHAVLSAGLAAAEQALALRPEAAWLLSKRGEARLALAGLAQARGGADPEPLLEGAVADLRRAAELDSGSARCHNSLGTALYQAAMYRRDSGRDPRGQLEAASAAFDHALEREAQYGAARFNRGTVRTELAEARIVAGGDPTELYAGALEDFDAALTLVSDRRSVRINRANCLRSMGEYAMSCGQDPVPRFTAALADLEELIAVGVPHAALHYQAGLSAFMLGLWYDHAAQAQAPGILQRALAHFDRAIALDPAGWRAHATRGQVLRALGRLEEALAAYDRALAIHADPRTADWRRAVAAALGR